MSATTNTGKVIAVCLRPTTGLPKHPQKRITVGPQGVDGDFHAGPINKHKKRGDPEPNNRMLTVIGLELLEAVNAELGTHLGPGDLGENVLVSGFGDLSDLNEGDRFKLGADVVLRVTRQNKPCSTLDSIDARLLKGLVGRRGVATVVEQTGVVKPGDAVEVVRVGSPSL